MKYISVSEAFSCKLVVEQGALTQQDHIDRLTEDIEKPERHWVAIGITDEDGYAESVAYSHPNNANAIVHAFNTLPKLVEELRQIKVSMEAEHFGYLPKELQEVRRQDWLNSIQAALDKAEKVGVE